MKTYPLRALAVRVLLAVAATMALAAPAGAARVGVLANKWAAQTAEDFGARIPAHTFSPVDTSTAVPTLQSLTNAFDVILLFEDSTFSNSTAVGNVVAGFANTGRAVVIGAFYEQDRSDGPASNVPHGWGALELIDPNTTDGTGTPYSPKTLDVATMLRHPLTGGLTALSSAKFAGGNRAKPGTTVVAYWKQSNALGQPDPAIAFRITGPACVVQVTIAPSYPSIGVPGTDYAGDFHRVWKNAFDFGANKCIATTGDATTADPATIPTLSQWGLLLTILLVGAGAVLQRRRIFR